MEQAQAQVQLPRKGLRLLVPVPVQQTTPHLRVQEQVSQRGQERLQEQGLQQGHLHRRVRHQQEQPALLPALLVHREGLEAGIFGARRRGVDERDR